MTSANLNRIIQDSLEFIEKAEYNSYDPFDAMTNPVIDRLTTNHLLSRRIVTQINARLPINLRFLGMTKMVHTKTVSDMLSAYSLLFKQTKTEKYFLGAESMFKKLMEKRISTVNGIGWGLNFKYTTRYTNASSATPNLYNIVNSANALLDFGEISRKDDLERIFPRILSFLETELGIIDMGSNTVCYRYYPNLNIHAYNVNALLAALFVRINASFDREIISPAKIARIVNFVRANQNVDGSWYYTDDKNGKWVDGFHTGFILESLCAIHHISNQYDLLDSIHKGMVFFKQHLFEESGLPLYYPNKFFPIESQNCAQAIQTIANCALYLRADDRIFLFQVIDSVVNALYDKRGYFFYKRNKYFVNKNNYLRWSQTPMILALIYSTNYLSKYD